MYEADMCLAAFSPGSLFVEVSAVKRSWFCAAAERRQGDTLPSVRRSESHGRWQRQRTIKGFQMRARCAHARGDPPCTTARLFPRKLRVGSVSELSGSVRSAILLFLRLPENDWKR